MPASEVTALRRIFATLRPAGLVRRGQGPGEAAVRGRFNSLIHRNCFINMIFSGCFMLVPGYRVFLHRPVVAWPHHRVMRIRRTVFSRGCSVKIERLLVI